MPHRQVCQFCLSSRPALSIGTATAGVEGPASRFSSGKAQHSISPLAVLPPCCPPSVYNQGGLYSGHTLIVDIMDHSFLYF